MRNWLADARAWRGVALLGLVVALPTLGLGLLVDDHLLRANATRDVRLTELHTAPWDAFHFFPGGDDGLLKAPGGEDDGRLIKAGSDADGRLIKAPGGADGGRLIEAPGGDGRLIEAPGGDDDGRLIDAGFGAWWQEPGGVARAFRPLPSLTHWVEHRAGVAPWLMHLHSAVWYAALCGLVALLYRRALAGWAAGLAGVLYAVDYGHAMVVGWIANRNALLAATFGVGALLLHQRERRVGAAVLFGAALASGVVGLGFAGYLFAHVVCLEPRRTWARALAPYLAVGVAWLAVYALGHFGTRGSGMYLDPRRAAFWLEFPAHLVLVLATELGGPGPDAWPLISDGPRAALVVVGAGVVLLAGFALAPVLRRDATARFLGLGAVLAAVPVCATTPAARLALVPGIGLVGLVALTFAAWRDARAQTPRVVATFAALAGVVHLVVSPLLFAVMLNQVAGIERAVQRLIARVPDEPRLAEQRLVVVNLPDLLFTLYVRPALATQGPARAVPRGLVTLGLGTHALELERVDERTVRVTDEAGFFGHDFSMLVRSTGLPMLAGSVVTTPTVTVTVEDARNGVPTRARFRFTRVLEDESLRWLTWDGEALVPFPLPRVGERVSLAAHGHPLLPK